MSREFDVIRLTIGNRINKTHPCKNCNNAVYETSTKLGGTRYPIGWVHDKPGTWILCKKAIPSEQK